MGLGRVPMELMYWEMNNKIAALDTCVGPVGMIMFV